MNGSHRSRVFIRNGGLRSCISAVLALCAIETATAHASIMSVDNCDDTGAGSLRDAIDQASSGDVIDLTSLVCGQISLTSGALIIPQASLQIVGGGVILDGTYHDRVVRHTGPGTLRLDGITVQHGKYLSDSTPHGGCVVSHGAVTLVDANVRNCTVIGTDGGIARGGGISTDGNLLLVASRVTDNTAQGNGVSLSTAFGGGAAVGGSLSATYSTFDHNRAQTHDDHHSAAGGFTALGSVTLVSSTLSNNYAVYFGAAAFEGQPTNAASIANSTIANNRARKFSGLYTAVPLAIANSTIAFNLALNGGGAVYSQHEPIELQSTIIAGNETGAGAADDLRGTTSTVVVGASNLITSTNLDVPADTITGCPHLASLDLNNGAVRTLALHFDSIALDAGNNVADLDEDERGYPRVIGAAADIGAFEYDLTSLVPEFSFHSGFEPTCDG